MPSRPMGNNWVNSFPSRLFSSAQASTFFPLWVLRQAAKQGCAEFSVEKTHALCFSRPTVESEESRCMGRA